MQTAAIRSSALFSQSTTNTIHTLICRCFWIALHAKTKYGALVVIGVTGLLAIQVFLNVAVVTNLIPATGISLPFFSYGGTALLLTMIEIGIVLAVSREIPLPEETETEEQP